MNALNERISLGNLPTPVERMFGLEHSLHWTERRIELWVKRDDATAGPEAGNKLRKLEYLLADAQRRGATTLITCGGIQSNHARATCALAARLGLKSHVFLRTTDGNYDLPSVRRGGNYFLMRLLGANVTLISPSQYRDRAVLMEERALALTKAGETPYVIPEGGSNGRGSLGYVNAVQELVSQSKGRPFDRAIVACGSGGTVAGLCAGFAFAGLPTQTLGMAVCDDSATFRARVDQILKELGELLPASLGELRYDIDDTSKGPGYAISTEEQRQLIVQVARASGLCLDPVYTGKAFHGLTRWAARGELDGQRVLFWHTGGLPGLLAEDDNLWPAIA